ncbi:LLM class flavin-dependent oxidoreductase [Streptomyces cinereospinus]|uniref:LLM class flavin-dependent oxidoreductase n=1 Tax=Streptomyces cinereospinus TaxID=285561 RepID=A0ABV5N330_9ACTN
MPRELHLSVALDGTSHRPTDPAHRADLIGLAEQGALDFVTVGTAPDAGPGPYGTVAALTRATSLSSRIGLVPTVTTTGTQPHDTFSALAALDAVSEGRAGWLVDVADTAPEAEADVWAEAVAATGTTARLWDGRTGDADTGGTTDRALGTGAVVPRAPQGRPPVAVALDVHDSDGPWELAAYHADVVLLDAEQPAVVRLARAALLGRAAEAGRDPDALRVLVRVAVDLGGTGAPPPADTLRFSGAAADLGRLLAEWHGAGGADGFHLLTASALADLRAVVGDLVPALRRHGLFRARYTGRTLRDHIGLPRPARRSVRDPESAV